MHRRKIPGLAVGDFLIHAIKDYFSSLAAASIASLSSARPAMSPSVVFSTEALIFFIEDLVASAEAFFSAACSARSARLAS